jgi:hypothetical protein
MSGMENPNIESKAANPDSRLLWRFIRPSVFERRAVNGFMRLKLRMLRFKAFAADPEVIPLFLERKKRIIKSASIAVGPSKFSGRMSNH